MHVEWSGHACTWAKSHVLWPCQVYHKHVNIPHYMAMQTASPRMRRRAVRMRTRRGGRRLTILSAQAQSAGNATPFRQEALACVTRNVLLPHKVLLEGHEIVTGGGLNYSWRKCACVLPWSQVSQTTRSVRTHVSMVGFHCKQEKATDLYTYWWNFGKGIDHMAILTCRARCCQRRQVFNGQPCVTVVTACMSTLFDYLVAPFLVVVKGVPVTCLQWKLCIQILFMLILFLFSERWKNIKRRIDLLCK